MLSGEITCATMFPACAYTHVECHIFSSISPPCSSFMINQPASIFSSCSAGALEKEGVTCRDTAYIEDKLFRQRVSLQRCQLPAWS